jgi:hypothetical protein
MGLDGKELLLRLNYTGNERTEHPYRGIENFVEDRKKRDFYYGDSMEPRKPRTP